MYNVDPSVALGWLFLDVIPDPIHLQSCCPPKKITMIRLEVYQINKSSVSDFQLLEGIGIQQSDVEIFAQSLGMHQWPMHHQAQLGCEIANKTSFDVHHPKKEIFRFSVIYEFDN